MSLTGTPFFASVIALTAIAVILPLAVWSKVRGPAVVRTAPRALMVVFAQVTAVAVVFVAVNRAEHFYASWAICSAPARTSRPRPTSARTGSAGRRPRRRRGCARTSSRWRASAGGSRRPSSTARSPESRATSWCGCRRSTTTRPTRTRSSRWSS
ncbi:hypothetical protein WKI68_18460 [Streptomyces sp. MS1.HAVA.3]|uniref:Uncharacterized protein n=1 Tax=Streptomyces caledonius TaxID=3134107 RepID=A0ABU8U6R0_9ACTN